MNDKMIFQVPAYIVRDKSLTGGGRQFVIETQENLNPDNMQTLINLENKLGWFTFNVDIIEAVDIVKLKDIKIDKSKYEDAKTPSQRLRSVLFLIWEKTGKREKFQNYYDSIIERLIESYKEKLNEL